MIHLLAFTSRQICSSPVSLINSSALYAIDRPRTGFLGHTFGNDYRSTLYRHRVCYYRRIHLSTITDYRSPQVSSSSSCHEPIFPHSQMAHNSVKLYQAAVPDFESLPKRIYAIVAVYCFFLQATWSNDNTLISSVIETEPGSSPAEDDIYIFPFAVIHTVPIRGIIMTTE